MRTLMHGTPTGRPDYKMKIHENTIYQYVVRTVLCLVSGWLHGSAVHPVCHNIRRHGSHKEQPHGNISPVSSSLQQFEFCDVLLYISSQRCTLCPKSAWIPFPLTFPSFFPSSFLFPSFSSIFCPCLLCHKGVFT